MNIDYIEIETDEGEKLRAAVTDFEIDIAMLQYGHGEGPSTMVKEKTARLRVPELVEA